MDVSLLIFGWKEHSASSACINSSLFFANLNCVITARLASLFNILVSIKHASSRKTTGSTSSTVV